jgi:periplasmic protein TonB
MFEDSTFESTGRIKTRSRRWMLAALTLNGSILVALILIPLIYPDALPGHFIPPLLVVPAAPQPPPFMHARAEAARGISEINSGHIVVPTEVPHIITYVHDPAPSIDPGIATGFGPSVPGADGANPFGARPPLTVVHPPAPATLRLPSRLVESTVIYKTIPQYPAIAKAAHQEGTVVLQAMISKAGTIGNLQVVSGPAMLQQAALDAVKTWRYRPYLLNDQPVEVETTVSVIFKLER